MATIINRRGASAVVHVVANTTVVITGNSSTSNIAFGGGNTQIEETVTNGYISQVWWGAQPSGYWTVARGSNTYLVLNNSGHMDFAGQGAAITADSTANAVLTLNGTANGFIMVEFQKLPNITQ
jgi:hypothetical protein